MSGAFPDHCPLCGGFVAGGMLAHMRGCPDRPNEETMTIQQMLEALGVRPRLGDE